MDIYDQNREDINTLLNKLRQIRINKDKKAVKDHRFFCCLKLKNNVFRLE